MIKKMSLLELLTLIIATIALLIAFLASSVNAENLPDLNLMKVTDINSRSISNIKYGTPYTIDIDAKTGEIIKPVSIQYENSPSSNNITSANSSLNRAEILKEKGVPGNGIDKAPGLKSPLIPTPQQVAVLLSTKLKLQAIIAPR